MRICCTSSRASSETSGDLNQVLDSVVLELTLHRVPGQCAKGELLKKKPAGVATGEEVQRRWRGSGG